MSKRMALAVFALALACTDGSIAQPSDGHGWSGVPFVIGAPGRLDAERDRRAPRRYVRDDSAVGAYADVEEVADPLWLQHEIEAYALRAFDCAGKGPPWSSSRRYRRKTTSRIDAKSSSTRGAVPDPARGLAAHRRDADRQYDDRLAAAAVCRGDAGRVPEPVTAVELVDSDAWARVGIDRLLYYADQVVAGLGAVEGEAYRRHALRFVADNLARVAQLRLQHGMIAAEEPTAKRFSRRARSSSPRSWPPCAPGGRGAPTPRLCAAPSIALRPGSLMSPLDASP
jgi:hypothetical protein